MLGLSGMVAKMHESIPGVWVRRNSCSLRLPGTHIGRGLGEGRARRSVVGVYWGRLARVQDAGPQRGLGGGTAAAPFVRRHLPCAHVVSTLACAREQSQAHTRVQYACDCNTHVHLSNTHTHTYTHTCAHARMSALVASQLQDSPETVNMVCKPRSVPLGPLSRYVETFNKDCSDSFWSMRRDVKVGRRAV
jgi:hypothetical protein